MSFIFRITACLFLSFLSLGVGAQQIVINELKDVDFGVVQPTIGDLLISTSLCVTMDQNGRYQVTAYGEGAGNAFVLSSGPYLLPYAVRYTDKKKPRGFQGLQPGIPLGNQRVRQNNNGTCRRTNANIEVSIAAADLLSAAGGVYRGTLTLMVSPE